MSRTVSWNDGDLCDAMARVVLPDAPARRPCDGDREAVRSFAWAEVESVGTEGRDPPPPADGRRPAPATKPGEKGGSELIALVTA